MRKTKRVCLAVDVANLFYQGRDVGQRLNWQALLDFGAQFGQISKAGAYVVRNNGDQHERNLLISLRKMVAAKAKADQELFARAAVLPFPEGTAVISAPGTSRGEGDRSTRIMLVLKGTSPTTREEGLRLLVASARVDDQCHGTGAAAGELRTLLEAGRNQWPAPASSPVLTDETR